MSAVVSIIYLTHRLEPRFEWFADSLARQTDGQDVEVILVDGVEASGRREVFEAIAAGRFPLRHVAAKPTPFAGPHRRTTRDYFAAASARNTGLICATAPYVACVDDLSVLMPGWWDEVRAAARRGDVIAGAYQKHWEMVVDDGVLVSSRGEASGMDSRWTQGEDSASVPVEGSQLFGCSFGAPRALMVEVNGFDELCDSIGGEDWNLGVRLQWSGAGIRYSRRMLTIESEEDHRVGVPALRLDKTAPPSLYMRRLREFGVRERHVMGRWDSSHMILDLLFGTQSTQTLGNYYLLSALDQASLDGVVKRMPSVHWFDGEPLSRL